MPEEYCGKDRRSVPRVVDSLEFTLGYDKYDFSSRTLNISTCGMLCNLNHKVPEMTNVEMAILVPSRLPDGQATTIKVKGVVVRNMEEGHEHDTAIFFTQISTADRRRLATYIRHKLNKSMA